MKVNLKVSSELIKKKCKQKRLDILHFESPVATETGRRIFQLYLSIFGRLEGISELKLQTNDYPKPMEYPEKNTESFIQTIIRTILTTTIIAVILSCLHLFPSAEKSKLSVFEMIWPAAFCIVFGGHWLELVFINYLKLSLPKNILLLYVIRIGYWFLCSIPLFFLANLSAHLFSHKTAHWGHWWTFGFLYIGIQLLMHAIMHIRFKKSFYNGVY